MADELSVVERRACVLVDEQRDAGLEERAAVAAALAFAEQRFERATPGWIEHWRGVVRALRAGVSGGALPFGGAGGE